MTAMKSRPIAYLLLLSLTAILAACSLINPQPEPEAEPTPAGTEVAEEPEAVSGEANVESLQILILESFPVQVNVIASGELPDGCTSLVDPTPRREGNTFVVNLATTRVQDEICTQAVVPFDKVISLPVEGLQAGDYTVAVNGVTDSFTLEADNVLDEATPEATSEPEDPGVGDLGSIGGRVWHDLCAISGGEGGAPAVPSDGCVELGDGAYQADGVREAGEPGIEGVTVTLGEGACPATGLAETTTDANGVFTFDDLEPGSYCVTVDALAEGNDVILIPGEWTAPEGDGSGFGSHVVEVSAGVLSGDIDFGWDYQFLPAAEGTPVAQKDCTDSAAFVADVTVLDDEVLPPTLVFTKTWRLQNNGTCTWNSDYGLVFVAGDQLGAPNRIPLAEEIAPEGIIDLSVQMTVPNLDGTWRSEWLLENEQGTQFGIPGHFWTQIVVTAAVPENAAHITGLVWADECSAPAAGTEVAPAGCIALADGGFLADGIYDVGEERIAGVTVSLGAGACPAAEATEVAVTDAYGRFAFTGLDAGTYCVFADSQSARNQAVLAGGAWSWPEGADTVASFTIVLEPLDGATIPYFGWDYQID